MRLPCLLALFLLFWQSALAAALQPVRLRIEYLEQPMGLDVPQPRFSWYLQALAPEARALRQTGYHLRVWQEAVAGRTIVWDSGEVSAATQAHIEYQGPPPLSHQTYTWAVRVQDQEGVWSDWSEPAQWTTGLLGENAWSARWIGSPPPDAPPADPQNPAAPDPWLRRSVRLSEKPVRALASVASVGYHELYVNGRKVGDAVLMPSVTDNSQRARYVTYDLAPLLKSGDNVLGLWLGTGWSLYPLFATADKPTAPLVRAQFDLTYADGREERIVTDEQWKMAPSPNVLLGVWNFMNFGGEAFDARREVPGWASPEYDDRTWVSAAKYAPRLLVSAENIEPNRLVHALRAVEVTEPEPGVYRVDLGRNFAGWVEADLRGEPGDTVELQFSEVADRAMTHRLRSQYTLGPTGRGTFRHRFNYASGRWVTFRGLRAPPQLDDVRGWMVRTDFAPAGDFESSHEGLNEIYRVTLWTLENVSLGGYLVDCPQRERMGYGGDGHATTTTALLNYHTGALFTTWALDWRDAADHGSSLGLGESATGRVPEPGNLPYTAPTYWGGGGPAWSGYCVHLPWEVYRHLGDQRILHDNFSTIENWLNFLESKSSDDLLRRWGGEWDFLGDWLWPGARGVNGDTRETLFFNNCYWIYNLVTASEIARLVGRPEQAREWDQRAIAVRRAVHREFFNPADASYVNGLQAYLAIALLVNVPPPEVRAAVWQRLEHEIREVRGGHIHAGITGGAFLFKTLMEARRDDLLYTMVGQEEYPSWTYLLRQGATTIPEDWEGQQSQLHSSYLYVGAWFIHGILGIQPAGTAGFRDFDVHPAPLDEPGLTWARGHYESMHGRIEVDWRRDAGQFQLAVTVPPNTTARVHLPAAALAHIREGGRPLAEVPEVESLGGQEGRMVVRVPSGRYTFTVDGAP